MTSRQAIVTVDLGYGDAGKGATVDALVRKTDAHTVVRYNGGAQAAHNVVTPDGLHHTFAQFGSGMLVPGTRTHLSRFVLLDPLAMQAEAEALGKLGVADAFERTTIDGDALVVTPFQRAANRLRELARGDGRHGSCGRGIGETMSDWLAHGQRVLFARDLGTGHARAKLEFLRELKRAELDPVLRDLERTEPVARELAPLERDDAVELCLARYREFAREAHVVGPETLVRILGEPGVTVFEGAQGVLLDEWYGFHPYTTWSTTTTRNALTLLAEAGFEDPVLRLGIVRAYGVRHGPGPFVTEDAELSRCIPEPHNGTNPWQREFRAGWFDLVATRYALAVTGGVDALAVTCLDRLADLPHPKLCTAYRLGAHPAVSHGPFFEAEPDGRIRRIRVVREPDLRHQEALSGLLGLCEPVLSPVADGGAEFASVREYLQGIAHELRLPLLLTSTGPTALDRQWLLAGRAPAGAAVAGASTGIGGVVSPGWCGERLRSGPRRWPGPRADRAAGRADLGRSRRLAW